MGNSTLHILGTRGIPANHGGFETFVQKLAEYLLSRGWSVTVYCQIEGAGPIIEDNWNGVRLIKVPEPRTDALGTIRYDWKCIRHAAKEEGVVLTLGYNTAIFNLWFRFKGIKNIINMDGIEWKRSKWGLFARAWFYLNDWCGCFIGNHLIADHPEIAKHLETRCSPKKISMIPYGADLVESADEQHVRKLGLNPNQYVLCVARLEPENSILEIVRAFSVKERGLPLVIVGSIDPNCNAYHARLLKVAGESVRFLGPIYDRKVVEALRFHCAFYIHGHTVGGTNPTLVESMGAGCSILAHDNPFNRWVVGESAEYFHNEKHCSQLLDTFTKHPSCKNCREKCKSTFNWPCICGQYEEVLVRITD